MLGGHQHVVPPGCTTMPCRPATILRTMPPAGFIISSRGGDGTVVTNTHIIADAIAGDSTTGSAILCTLQDGRSFPAQLVNFDWCASTPHASVRT